MSAYDPKAVATMNAVRKRTGAVVETIAADAETALTRLIQSDVDPNERKALLRNLGNGRAAHNKQKRRDTTRLHETLAKDFHRHGNDLESNDAVLQKLLDGSKCDTIYRLQDLLVLGEEGQTILHVVLDLSTYDDFLDKFDPGQLRSFIRFLLRIQPELPLQLDKQKRTPLFALLTSPEADQDQQDLAPCGLSKDEIVRHKQDIIRYLCDECSECSFEGSEKAIESLTKMASPIDPKPSRHALHVAIENDVLISENVVRRLSGMVTKPEGKQEKISCLEMADGNGQTCLHIALTTPFTEAKILWAKMLVISQPGLLKSTCKSGLTHGGASTTPLQHLWEQRNIEKQANKSSETTKQSRAAEGLRSKLDQLTEFLKHQCLAAFDNTTCMSIMYTRNEVHEIYLTFDKNDVVSGAGLKRLSQHYKLDTTVRSVHIPKITVEWDDECMDAHKIARDWRCVGSTQLYMIFHWLKDPNLGGVRKVLEVVVDDQEEDDRRSHSDQVIIESLKGLQIETWDWRRMDIASDVIFDAAGEHVKILYLYCSGRRAVLQSWSDRGGLARLKKLEKVYVQTHQGLESSKSMNDYLKSFESALKRTFEDVNQRCLFDVRWDLVKTPQKETPEHESQTSKLKDENEQGFEELVEQDWLKCMDEFADVIAMLSEKGGPSPVKVALIDDGVKSGYARLDDNIKRGVSLAKKKTTRSFSHNYNTSLQGHGTVMAYYIRRVCPSVSLYVAKLDPEPWRDGTAGSGLITFSMDSVVDAIKWAVEENVDIICMSWAIDYKETDIFNSRGQALEDAIRLAANKNILLFCANPDKGPGQENNTYPLRSDIRVFCIGAATQDGHRWSKIDSEDKSCNYFLPGVELGIEVENNQLASKKNLGEPPDKWRVYSGSSLSCALAAGLAAMILYCAQVSGITTSDQEWAWLKSHGGMQKALDSIYVTQNRWLPVRRVFGLNALLGSGKMAQKKEVLRREIVARFLASMPHTAKELELAPAGLRKQPTMKEG